MRRGCKAEGELPRATHLARVACFFGAGKCRIRVRDFIRDCKWPEAEAYGARHSYPTLPPRGQPDSEMMAAACSRVQNSERARFATIEKQGGPSRADYRAAKPSRDAALETTQSAWDQEKKKRRANAQVQPPAAAATADSTSTQIEADTLTHKLEMMKMLSVRLGGRDGVTKPPEQVAQEEVRAGSEAVGRPSLATH